MDKVILYVDGACSGNPGPGGWGVLLQYRGTEKELSGAEPNTTNNQMELKAAIEGLRALKRSCKVEVYTDSEYVKNGITTWIHDWRKRNWKNAAKKPVKNQELWQELDALTKEHEVEWHWVKGHSGHPLNDRVDELARRAIEQLPGDNL